MLRVRGRKAANADVRGETGRLPLRHAVQRRVLRAVALVADRGDIERPQGLLADGLHK